MLFRSSLVQPETGALTCGSTEILHKMFLMDADIFTPPRSGRYETLERVMNSVRNGLGMRETEITREPSRLWNPHSYAVFA